MKFCFASILIAFASFPHLSRSSPINDDYLSSGKIEERHENATTVFHDWLAKEEAKHPDLDCYVHETICNNGGWGAKAECPVTCADIGPALKAEFKTTAIAVGDALGCFLDNWACGQSYGLAAGCPPPCDNS